MTSQPSTIRIGLAWYEVLLCLLAAVPGALGERSPALGLLGALAAGIAFGVWRVARLVGETLEYTKLQAGVYDEEGGSS